MVKTLPIVHIVSVNHIKELILRVFTKVLPKNQVDWPIIKGSVVKRKTFSYSLARGV